MPRDWPDPRWPPDRPMKWWMPWLAGAPIALSLAWTAWNWVRQLW